MPDQRVASGLSGYSCGDMQKAGPLWRLNRIRCCQEGVAQPIRRPLNFQEI